MTTLREKIEKILRRHNHDNDCTYYSGQELTKHTDAILEAVREELPPVDRMLWHTATYEMGQDAYRTAVLKVLEGR